MSDSSDRIKELQEYKLRLERDISRIKAMGGHIMPNEPISRNYRNVNQELNKLKK